MTAGSRAMIPEPEEVAALVDRAEEIARRGASYWANGGLMRHSREDRRRLLAWAVLETLRRQRQDGGAVIEPVGVR